MTASFHRCVSFSAFGAPIVQGRQGVAVQEAYDLTGTNYYNPNWGYQTSADGSTRACKASLPWLSALSPAKIVEL